jgi:protein-S-isoprenylcysteine O-methyltransferase Ste14
MDMTIGRLWHTARVLANDNDAAPVRFPPPFVYLIAVIVGALLHAYVLPLRCDLGLAARVTVATAIATLGTVFMIGAIGLFRRTGQDPKPWKTTPEIISTGIYRYTRNPMYVGMALFQIAIGIGFANGWILALFPPVIAIIYAMAIRHEEAYLERKFGAPYIDYKKSVRRWL